MTTGVPLPRTLRHALCLAVAFLFLTVSAPGQSAAPFRIGLNFPFAGPTNPVVSVLMTNLVELNVRATRHLAPGDVTWNNLQATSSVPLNFNQADQVFFNTNSVLPLGSLYDVTSNTNSTGLQVPWIQGAGFNFTSAEMTAASNYVSAVVSRYKTATHYWEIANEMNTKTNRNIGLPVDEFASFLVTNRYWIQLADPEAKVVLPGCLGNFGYPLTNTCVWLRQLLTRTGSAGFDVMNYHDYKSWWVLPADYDQLRAILDSFGMTNMPIWITECSSSSVLNNPTNTVPYASEDEQAADVWRRSCTLFGRGAAAWFWHSLYSGPSGGFAHNGLLTPSASIPSGQKKKSWHAFQLLVSKIEGFQSATALSLHADQTNNASGGAGQWAVQFDWNDGTRRTVVWSGTNLDYTLTGLDTNASPYTITTVVPATLSADGKTATFTSVTNPLTGTSLQLSGTNLPVLVESTLTPFQIWANTYVADPARRGEGDDPDGDNLSNRNEYLAGTDPGSSNSVLRITAMTLSNSIREVTWTAHGNHERLYRVLTAPEPGQAFTGVLFSNTLGGGASPWYEVTNTVTDSSSLTQQFYRIESTVP